MKSLLLAALRGYKRFISPALSASCRYTPTCSDYAAEAIARHGAIYGSALAVWRLARCNPLGRGGLDLVPTKLRHHHYPQPDVHPGCSSR
jgi:uncharacterized protein